MNNKIINDLISHHETVLQTLIKEMDIPAQRVKDAINYSLFNGGKRMRPILVYLCGQLLDVKQQQLDIIAAAIELTHCYSLIHDDLPAMDDDDFRRGKPSCHRAFDEATAILAGDALQILAIDILLSHLPPTLASDKVIAVTKELVMASGPAGMISGQSLDLSELIDPTITEPRLCEIHRLKTGQLMLSCVNMVIAAGNPTLASANALQQFAQHLGLVFQLQDDYLDKYGASTLGKGRASDTANQKTTFATLYDQQALAQLITKYYQQALEALNVFAERADLLRAFIDYLYRRTL